MKQQSAKWIKWIGAIIGGIYGFLALGNFWFDFYDILIKIGLISGHMGTWLINYPMAILIHAIIGFGIGYLIQLIASRKS